MKTTEDGEMRNKSTQKNTIEFSSHEFLPHIPVQQSAALDHAEKYRIMHEKILNDICPSEMSAMKKNY